MPTCELIIAATALFDWAREHTGPRDPNSPHDILIALQKALAECQASPTPDGEA
jgi:hypothetical protein